MANNEKKNTGKSEKNNRWRPKNRGDPRGGMTLWVGYPRCIKSFGKTFLLGPTNKFSGEWTYQLAHMKIGSPLGGMTQKGGIPSTHEIEKNQRKSFRNNK